MKDESEERTRQVDKHVNQNEEKNKLTNNNNV